MGRKATKRGKAGKSGTRRPGEDVGKPEIEPSVIEEMARMLDAWDATVRAWAATASGTTEDERLHAELGRHSEACREFATVHLPAGSWVRVGDTEAWHDGKPDHVAFRSAHPRVKRPPA